ncbi:hypothetical protein [Leptospira sp. 'Mane']|uniref:hypothetical protein n=1 Tax=Leptospira sp. 'Mane' TaxID=3387407 RepID=UPI00398AD9CB
MYRTVLFILAISSSFTTILSQKLLLKSEKFLWEGHEFSFPENVVIKEQTLNFETTVHIYPAERDPFFIVLRKLPLHSLSFERAAYESEIFWHGKNNAKETLNISGLPVLVHRAEQIRNQNLLKANLWLWSKSPNHYWAWIFWRKERTDLEDFFEKGLFIRSIGKE